MKGDDGRVQRKRPVRPPMPDEPYQPEVPPWPPQRWDQLTWDRWWAELVRWCEYCVTRLGENVPELPPPPPVTAQDKYWRGWWVRLQLWGWLGESTAEWPPFPKGWVEGQGLRCSVCGGQRAAGRCPSCRSPVCRECLYLSRDICPMDLYAAKQPPSPAKGGRSEKHQGKPG